jgi:chemotaxis protein CheX
VKPEHIKPFLSATQLIFKTMLGLDVKMRQPSLKQDRNVPHDVSGIVGLSGELAGNIVVSFPVQVAEKLASAFAGADVRADDEEFADAIGELTNMIAGSGKKELNGMNLAVGIPNVVVGPGHTVHTQRSVPSALIPCQTEHGPFAIEIHIKTNREVVVTGAASQGAAK